MNIKLAMLPQPPAWKSREVSFENGPTKGPIILFYRNALEVFRFLFANPLVANRQNHVPSEVRADLQNDIRILDESSTGDLVFKIQVSIILLCFAELAPLANAISFQDQVGNGETLGSVTLSSDKTLLSTGYGDKLMTTSPAPSPCAPYTFPWKILNFPTCLCPVSMSSRKGSQNGSVQ